MITLTNKSDYSEGTSGDDYIRGLGGDDTIYALAGNDRIDAGDGDDFIDGMSGADTLDGGSGTDRVGYYNAASAVQVNLAAGTAQDGFGYTDKLANIEGLVGSKYGDLLVGDDGNNEMAGLKGWDTLKGGEGTDWLRHDLDDNVAGTTGVTVNFAKGFAIDGWGYRDTIEGFEQAGGTIYNDLMIGDDGDNHFWANSGNDTLDGGAGADTLKGGAGADSISGGDGDDFITGQAGADTIDGGDGEDEVYFGSQDENTGSIKVYLNKGYAIDDSGSRDTLISIEQVQGGSKNDILIGDGEDNTLIGLRGNDTLRGGAGHDVLSYWVDDWYGADTGVTINLAKGYAIDGWGDRDTIAGFEEVHGSIFDNKIIGSRKAEILLSYDGNDTINGGGGNDSIRAGGGSDVLNGGKGRDYVSYLGNEVGVKASLVSNTVTDSTGKADTLRSIENLTGSDHNDVLIGNKKANEFIGFEGADTIKGGAGSDTVVYSNAWDGEDGIRVNLAKKFAVDRYGDRDKLVSIENVVATDQDDTIAGSRASNMLSGLGGDDLLKGGKGNDTLIGGEGNDTMLGQAGKDVFVFLGSDGNDEIRGLRGNDMLDYSEATDITDAQAFLAEFGSVSGDDYVIDVEGNVLTLVGFNNEDQLENMLIL